MDGFLKCLCTFRYTYFNGFGRREIPLTGGLQVYVMCDYGRSIDFTGFFYVSWFLTLFIGVSHGIVASICQPLTFCFYSRVLIAGAAASTARAIIETPLELAKVLLGFIENPFFSFNQITVLLVIKLSGKHTSLVLAIFMVYWSLNCSCNIVARSKTSFSCRMAFLC